jgi:hypothetical protein
MLTDMPSATAYKPWLRTNEQTCAPQISQIRRQGVKSEDFSKMNTITLQNKF